MSNDHQILPVLISPTRNPFKRLSEKEREVQRNRVNFLLKPFWNQAINFLKTEKKFPCQIIYKHWLINVFSVCIMRLQQRCAFQKPYPFSLYFVLTENRNINSFFRVVTKVVEFKTEIVDLFTSESKVISFKQTAS